MAEFSFDNLVKEAEALEKKRVSEKAELGGATSSIDDKKTDDYVSSTFVQSVVTDPITNTTII